MLVCPLMTLSGYRSDSPGFRHIFLDVGRPVLCHLQPRGEPMNLGRYTKILGGARALAAAAGWVAISACGASADVAASGSFVATKGCPAFQSFRKGINPGGVKIEIGHSYPLLAKNASNVTHYRIRIDGASPPERWVSVDCGRYTDEGANDGGSHSSPVRLITELLLDWSVSQATPIHSPSS